MNLFGTHDPTGGDGYIRGAWDDVRVLFGEGKLSEEAYTVLREAVYKVGQPPAYPEFENPEDKFKPLPDGAKCERFQPILDSSMRGDGVMCCSACRAPMMVADGKWVHAE